MGTTSSASKRPVTPDSPCPNKNNSYYDYLDKFGGKNLFNRHGIHEKVINAKHKMSDNVLTRRRSNTVSESKDKLRSLYTVFRWEKGGKNVYISGDWDNWKAKIQLVASHGNFATILQIPEGLHQYKFYVDNRWVIDENQPTIDNDLGTKNNIIEVNKTDFEVFDALAVDIASLRHAKNVLNLPESDNLFTNIHPPKDEFKLNVISPPLSPIKIKENDDFLQSNLVGDNSHTKGMKIPTYLTDIDIDSMDYYTLWDYNQKIPLRIHQKLTQTSSKEQNEPPLLPPQLLQVLLNRDIPYYYEPALLPEPPSRAVLNHLYALSIKDGVLVVSCTHRFKKKYVTTLFYKQVKW